MSHLPRILDGAIRGALFGLAVGTGFAGVGLLLTLPNSDPMDRWNTGIAIFALVVSSSTVVGLVAGLASRVSEHGLSFFKSTMIVAAAGIVAIPFAPIVKSGMFLLAPLVGILVGGIAVVMAGIARTNALRSTKQEGKNTAGKA
jgi:hypothetical protein